MIALTRRLCMGAICAVLAILCGAAPASGAFDDPLFVFTPKPPPPPAEPVPPPTGYLNGPCGLAVDSAGRFYVSDYYHDVVDVFTATTAYVGQLQNVDPLGGPCGLAFDAANRLYVNDFHRNVTRYGAFPAFGSGTLFPLPSEDPAEHLPTGIAVDPVAGNVYVNHRTYISVFDSSGAPVLDGGNPLKIGLGTLGDGYGVAYSQFPGIPETPDDPEVPATLGRLYVPDASTNTVKVYDPAIDTVDPVAELGHPLGGGFTSLRDSAIAVDRVRGEIYLADNTQPEHTERPQATIHVFSPTNAYRGHLKFRVITALPAGLAVDNSTNPTQGRVYVTSGNTDKAGVYAYPPGAATMSDTLPPSLALSLSTGGSGGGKIGADLADISCATFCEAQVRSGATVSLSATPDPGSVFTGWSGGGCEGAGSCTVTMSEARSVSGEFDALSGPPALAPDESAKSGGEHPSTPPRPRAGTSAIAQKGTLRIAVDGEMRPRRLPRTGVAPIAVSVGGRITTTDQSQPPQLAKLRIELNRHGRLDYAGLPTCRYESIQPGSSSRALAACRSALVGRGSFTANITLAGQEPYPTQGGLLIFNGRRGGKPVLYGHIYAPRPFATSFVIVFAIERIPRGTFGTALNARLPKAMEAWGRLTGLQMTLERRYSHRGQRHSYLSSGCPAPKGFRGAIFPLARATFSFAGNKSLTSAFTDTCKVQGR